MHLFVARVSPFCPSLSILLHAAAEAAARASADQQLHRARSVIEGVRDVTRKRSRVRTFSVSQGVRLNSCGAACMNGSLEFFIDVHAVGDCRNCGGF
jgi:hypothetical protein